MRDKSGRAIPTFGKVGSGRDLPSRLFSKVGSGQDWPSRTFKIVKVSREKLREVGKSREKLRFNPTFPIVFDLKTAGKIEEKPDFP